MENLEIAGAVGAFCAEFLLLHDTLRASRLPGISPFLQDVITRPADYASVAVANARAGNIGTSNIFASVLAEQEKDVQAMDDLTIKNEAIGIAAGSGTTAVTLTYLVWAVLRRPDLQIRLEKELSDLDPEAMSDAALGTLPLLNRIYGAAPGSLPRMIPAGGAMLDGYFMPAGVTVSTHAYSIHREETLFPRAGEFDPDRFLRNPLLAERQMAAIYPFGGWART